MAYLSSTIDYSSLFSSSSGSNVVSLSSSLLTDIASSQLTQASLRTLSPEERASYNVDLTSTVVAPWEEEAEDDTKTLEAQVRAVRELEKFIDLDSDVLNSVAGDSDRTATFALYRALENLKVLAEYAADEDTSAASLSRLNDKFQQGFAEIEEYISTVSLDKLDLFMGDKVYKTETSVRTGKNEVGYDGSTVADNASTAISGLNGDEVFTITFEKGGDTDDITVDLSGMSGDPTLENVKNYINTQIESLVAIDDEQQEYSKYQTRFDVRSDSSGRAGLQIDGTLTETITLSAAVAEPTLYVTSAVNQLDDSFATTSRISEFVGLSGTLTLDDTISFAGIDVDETAIKELTDDSEDDDDELSDSVKALRDELRAEALADVQEDDDTSDETDDEDEDASSVTNINSDYKVNADTAASKVVTGSDGSIYVVGTSTGTFGQQINTANEQDVFLTKFDTEGNLLYSRLLGASEGADAYGLTIDSEDNVIVVGQTDSALSSGDVIDSKNGDVFVAKYSDNGDEVFRYQLDTYAESGGYSVAVDSNNDIYVGGYTKSAVSSTSGYTGGKDALILKLDGTDGDLLDSNVFGTSGNDVIKGIAVDANDNLIVAAEQSGNGVITRIDSSDLSNQTSSVDLGYLGSSGSLQGISIDDTNGAVYVAGVTTNTNLNAGGAATVNEAARGAQEGFVSGLTFSGENDLSANFTTYISTTGTDRVADVVVQDGVVYVAGSTSSTISGEDSRGATDGFVSRINGASGALEDTQQFGESLAYSNVGGIAFTTKGNSVLETLGLPTGTIGQDETLDIETQTSAIAGDYFYISIDGESQKKITLEKGDTLDDIARKIKLQGIGKLEVDVASTSEGDKLKISTLDEGVSIDLLPGKNGDDLLQHLGLEAGKLLPKNEVLGLDDDEDSKDIESTLGGVYGLGLEGALNIKDKSTAKYVLGLLNDAVATVQRAFRSLEYNPYRDQVNNQSSGTVPPYLQNQLSNYQAGLDRLTAGSSSSSSVSLYT